MAHFVNFAPNVVCSSKDRFNIFGSHFWNFFFWRSIWILYRFSHQLWTAKF